jgi:hypothetical protein
MTRLTLAGDSKTNAIGASLMIPVTAPATDDGRGGLAHLHDVVIIHRTNWLWVFDHHFRIRRHQSEKIEHYKAVKTQPFGKR